MNEERRTLLQYFASPPTANGRQGHAFRAKSFRPTTERARSILRSFKAGTPQGDYHLHRRIAWPLPHPSDWIIDRSSARIDLPGGNKDPEPPGSSESDFPPPPPEPVEILHPVTVAAISTPSAAPRHPQIATLPGGLTSHQAPRRLSE